MDAEQDGKIVLDLTRKNLKKVPKQDDAQNVKVLILDENDLQKIDNIDSYLRIEKLSLCKNQLLRMYGVCRLHCLKELHLAHNGIMSIEGLKELTHLVHLNLEGNNIKTIEHLNTNIKLEYVNLSENSIGNISDISFLKCLKDLYLHGNRITHLRQCEKYLPVSLETITLARNGLTDLNEICSLSNLINLRSISITENPCVQMTGNTVGFDYRPFVLNWCMSAKVIDGFVVNPIESLKAEWLYSQGRGRQFRIGEQLALARYLSTVCPLSGEVLENENERKLRLILSKAQQHQRQLQEEISENANTSGGSSPSSARRKSHSTRLQSPRFSRLGRQSSPDSMSSSYHGNTSTSSLLSAHNDTTGNGNNMIHMTTSLISNIQNESIMAQSLDSSVLSSNNNRISSNILHDMRPTSAVSQLNGSQLVSASKMVPVPESLMSPDCGPYTVLSRTPLAGNISSYSPYNIKSNKSKEKKTLSPKINRNVNAKKVEKSPVLNNSRKSTPSSTKSNGIYSEKCKEISVSPPQNQTKQLIGDGSSNDSDDSDNINMEKLKFIKTKAAQQCAELAFASGGSSSVGGGVGKTKSNENAIILIQKMWRGYRTRKLVKNMAAIIQKKRTDDYIQKLTHDMETTKVALENERKIQQLQMQAINALWKKVSTMQTTDSTTAKTATGDSHNNNSMVSMMPDCSAGVVQDLAKTCSVLTNQVQQLQGSMRDIINCMTLFLPQQENVKNMNKDVKDSSGTQTEIVAVHTPQVDNPPFPFNNKLMRPSTLPLDSKETSPLPPDDFKNNSNGDDEDDVNSQENNDEDNHDVEKENATTPIKDNVAEKEFFKSPPANECNTTENNIDLIIPIAKDE